MKVVSDASPLIALSAIGRLSLLRHLFPETLIPEAVHREIQVESRPGASEVLQAAWIQTQSVESGHLLSALTEELDLGEAEAITLALETEADVLLIDERRGRQVARRLGCRVLGLLGALVQAKRQGHLVELTPVLRELDEIAGFYVAGDLRRQVLDSVGEES